MTHTPQSTEHASVETLNEALRIYRRLLAAILLIVVGGFAVVFGLSKLSTFLAPPYGLNYLGWSLTEWGMVALIVVLFAYLWLTGRKLGRLLNDQTLLSFPVVAILSAVSVIAQRAHAMGMEWSGFFGPLRPVRR